MEFLTIIGNLMTLYRFSAQRRNQMVCPQPYPQILWITGAGFPSFAGMSWIDDILAQQCAAA
jgi:hypothetical protein